LIAIVLFCARSTDSTKVDYVFGDASAVVLGGRAVRGGRRIDLNPSPVGFAIGDTEATRRLELRGQ
jgi:hypothetical protein